MKFFTLLPAVLALAACATQPLSDLPPSHPASPVAAEAPARPVANLADDTPTRTTEQLLAPPPGPAQ